MNPNLIKLIPYIIVFVFFCLMMILSKRNERKIIRSVEEKTKECIQLSESIKEECREFLKEKNYG